MSHDATNWAIKQRGLDPASKLLLWQLADRHNRDTGRCDPSQERLAEDTEMSRASVNRHLAKLEDAGLIRRVKRIDPKTKRQGRTAYQLAFDTTFSESQIETRPVSQIEPEPCLKSGQSRVSNCDTNPVREPGREYVSGVSKDLEASFKDFWDVYPRPRSREATRKLFLSTVAEGVDPERLVAAAEVYRSENDGNRSMYLCYSDNWLEKAGWKDVDQGALKLASGDRAPKRKPCTAESTAHLFAQRIAAGKFVASSALSAGIVREMLGKGWVTPEQLRNVGVKP